MIEKMNKVKETKTISKLMSLKIEPKKWDSGDVASQYSLWMKWLSRNVLGQPSMGFYRVIIQDRAI